MERNVVVRFFCLFSGHQVAGAPQAATEVLCLMNMVTKEELEDDEEYEGGLYIEPPQPTSQWGIFVLECTSCIVGCGVYIILLLLRYHGGCEGRMRSLWRGRFRGDTPSGRRCRRTWSGQGGYQLEQKPHTHLCLSGADLCGVWLGRPV